MRSIRRAGPNGRSKYSYCSYDGIGLSRELGPPTHSVIDALLEEVGWEEKTAMEQPDLLAEEVRHARLAPQEWEDQKPAADSRSLARRLRSLAAHLSPIS